MSEGLHRLRGVEIFAAGNPRGKTYTRADLDSMVDNFRRSSAGDRPALRVPAVLGHDEAQEFLERSDIPAAGWAERIYRDGDVLKADFDNVPPKVAQLLKSKAYRKVSAEVYDEPPNGIPGKGKMLRRVAFLGGEIPQVKNLDDIPMPEPHGEQGETYSRIRFADSQQSAVQPGLYQCFSEVTKMAMPPGQAAAMWAQTDDRGLHDKTKDGKSEYDNEEMQGGWHAKMAEEDKEYENVPPEKAEEMRERARAGFKKYAERCRKMGETDEALKTYLAGVPLKKDDAETPADRDPTPPEPKKFAEQFRPLIEVAKEELRKEFAPIQKQVHDFEANTRRASVEKFCESMVQAGKIIPAEMDRGKDGNQPNIIDRLLRADAREKVHKFSENGKSVALTELDLQMREIERRPVLLKFNERRVATDANGVANDEKAAVEAHYESFAETYQKTGTSKEELVKAFEAAKKVDPKLTADKFLKPSIAV